MELLRLEDVTVEREKTRILSHINWQVDSSDRWVVLGPNGAGKTTLVELIGAQSLPTSGSVHLLGQKANNENLEALRPFIGVCSSCLADNTDKDTKVLDFVASSIYGKLKGQISSCDGFDLERAADLLAKFGVSHLSDRQYGTLSTGEKKRVEFARALMPDPEILILDEPSAGLDLGGRESLIDLLAIFATSSYSPALILVTHHVEEIPAGFNKLLCLRAGQTVASGNLIDTLSEDTLSRTFGLPLQLVNIGSRWSAHRASN